MDPVTIIGLIVVAVMFSSGVALVWYGLRRHSAPLPAGAEDVLTAVAEGRLGGTSGPVIDLVRPPAEPPRAASATPAVRLVAREEATVRRDTEPEAVPADANPPSAENRSDDFDRALFGAIDDPSASPEERAFFEKTPELQRF
jgi:hypothetical protein